MNSEDRPNPKLGALIALALNFKEIREPLVGYIYLLRQGDIFKIGRSKNPSERRRVHNNTSPVEVSLEHKLHVIDMESAESWLHRRFKQKLIKNEWFRLTPEDVAWVKQLRDGFYNEST